MTVTDLNEPKRSGGVQSIQRTFTLLEIMADNGATMGLSQLAEAADLPLPTIHRLVRTLVELGYLRQDANRQYVLGPKLTWLGECAASTLAVWAQPHLQRVVDEVHESANLAMLESDHIVYVAQEQSQRSMRMFTEIGRRVLPHATAVGKVLLAQLTAEQVSDILRRTGMPRQTASTITDPAEFLHKLAGINESGYAIDEGEQEVGVRCVAVAVPDVAMPLALSISGPAPRMTEDLVARAVPVLSAAAAGLAKDLA